MESEQLREQLQTSLGVSYALERELGGGGMSRVFVAIEKTLGRTVVVKVLPPELALEGVIGAQRGLELLPELLGFHLPCSEKVPHR